MNYEKIHNDSLEMAKQLLEEGKISKESMERMFPELAESSEDERIRKALIRFHKSTIDIDGIKGADIIAWLEKQGEKTNPYNGISFEYNGHIWGMCVRDNGVDILLDKQLFKHLEKQDEQNKQISWEKCNHCEYFDGYDICLHKKNFGSVTNESKENCENNKFYFEKQSGQKPTDKAEPKFHKGDWVIDNQGIVHQIANVVENTISDSYGYDTVDGEYFNDCMIGIKLWTIQDAKDGDVLAAHECYVIFKEIDGLNIKCYCTYHYLGFNPIFYVNTLQNKDAFQPATKEQRDALMKAMSDAGYTFDFEKKEFKKIEQKQEWTGEDERLFISALWHIKNSVGNSGKNSGEFEIYNWLKSLKERVQNLKPQSQWKPSDEQIMALKWALNRVPYYSYTAELHGLLEQLKKLREE